MWNKDGQSACYNISIILDWASGFATFHGNVYTYVLHIHCLSSGGISRQIVLLGKYAKSAFYLVDTLPQELGLQQIQEKELPESDTKREGAVVKVAAFNAFCQVELVLEDTVPGMLEVTLQVNDSGVASWAMPSAVYIIGAADGDSEFIFTRGKTTKVEVNSSERIMTDFGRMTRLGLGTVPYVGLPELSTVRPYYGFTEHMGNICERTKHLPPLSKIIASYTPIPITFVGHDVRPRHPPPPPHLNPVLQETKSILDGLTHDKACILITVKAANDLPQLTSWYDRRHHPSMALEPDPPSLQEPPPACRANRNIMSRHLVEVLRRPSNPPASSKGKAGC
ncbi:hypothetical protein JB92DRAFT_3214734 [Gautieria morchelliformis]|nr:hypothetical protein JB92DRAFT_3214734 [Gautieria morchelliformis]